MGFGVWNNGTIEDEVVRSTDASLWELEVVIQENVSDHHLQLSLAYSTTGLVKDVKATSSHCDLRLQRIVQRKHDALE